LQTEKELDPEGLRKESEREQAILALTSTLDKLIKRLQENQSPELVQKYKKRRVVPQKPPPSPHPTGESSPQREGTASESVPSSPSSGSTVQCQLLPPLSSLQDTSQPALGKPIAGRAFLVCSMPTAWWSAWHTGKD
jgi:hypothetical protein